MHGVFYVLSGYSTLPAHQCVHQPGSSLGPLVFVTRLQAPPLPEGQRGRLKVWSFW